MIPMQSAISSFSITDPEKTRHFYGQILGLQVDQEPMGLKIHLPGGSQVFAYPKDGHRPATFTILNFIVNDIDEAVDVLLKSGVTFDRYDGMETDERGIMRGKKKNTGPDIAWFKDPSGNILSVLEE